MVWSTSRRKSSGRKAAPLSHTFIHSVATSYASPAVPGTLYSNTSTHSIQDSYPSHNSGATSTATSPKPQQTSPCTPPTTTWLASSTRHNFFGDPVELEPVDDFHLLGFNIDLQQRTVTYIQPSQPWKIRDATTAGSQRLALSGLQSRLHTIHKYTFPPSSAEAAAAELVKLYVQKGHNQTACSRFLKRKSADHGDLCVSTPGPRVHHHHHHFHHCFTRRGVQHLWSTARNEATTTDGKGSRTLDPVPADQHTDSNGPPCRCLLVSWFFMLPPPNSPQPYSRLATALRRPSDRSSLQT